MKSVPRLVAVSGCAATIALVMFVTTVGTAHATTPSGPRARATSAAGATIVVRPPAGVASAVVGDDVRVEIVACAASCGYTWRVTSEPAASVARYVSTKYRPAEPSKHRIGGNDIESVTFLATGEGSTWIVLKYFPPGRGAKPTSTYRLHLRVR
jgi:hypothetical protein